VHPPRALSIYTPENLSFKLDAAQIHALRKIATMKAIPYQTLIRQWLAEGIRRELHLGQS